MGSVVGVAVQLGEVMAAAGVVLDASTGTALARSLAAVRAARPGSGGLVSALATRAMSEAQYFSAGERYPLRVCSGSLQGRAYST